MQRSHVKKAISAWELALRLSVRLVNIRIKRVKQHVNNAHKASTAMELTLMKMVLIALQATTAKLEQSTASSTHAQEVHTMIRQK